MTAQPEPIDGLWVNDVDRLCPECGGPIEDGPTFRICQGCYDAYVDNAGR